MNNYIIYRRSKMEFSKKILVMAMILNIALDVFACVMIYLTRDTNALVAIVVATIGEVGTIAGFYYNKSKAENSIKIQNNITEESKEEDGI